MNKNFFVITCLLLSLSSCQFSRENNKDREFVVATPESLLLDSQYSSFDASLNLDTDYISNFRLDGFTDLGEESVYLRERTKLIDAYNA